MIELPKDCMSCSHSMVTDDDKLYCLIKNKIVKDEDNCEDYN